MHQPFALESLLAAFTDLASHHLAAAAAAERAWEALAHGSEPELRVALCPNCGGTLPTGRPVINPATFGIEWRGNRFSLGPGILFRLFHRLSRSPNRYFEYDILKAEVWHGRCADTTVRSTVKRLRKALCAAGMEDLALAIRGQNGCYGLFLHDETFEL